jgi:hypothetical protein
MTDQQEARDRWAPPHQRESTMDDRPDGEDDRVVGVATPARGAVAPPEDREAPDDEAALEEGAHDGPVEGNGTVYDTTAHDGTAEPEGFTGHGATATPETDRPETDRA